MNVEFAAELARVLPDDIPHRDRLIEKAAAHLTLILAANEHFNLTRIINAPEAAIKHVFDSVAPWRYFAGVRRVLDAGTGAGFPGVPLSARFARCALHASRITQKKARFVDSAVESLELHNVEVLGDRAEQIALAQRPEIITARAVAPLDRLVRSLRQAHEARCKADSLQRPRSGNRARRGQEIPHQSATTEPLRTARTAWVRAFFFPLKRSRKSARWFRLS